MANEPANQSIQRLLSILGPLFMEKKRAGMRSGLIEQQNLGYQKLEEQRSGNAMNRINETFLNQISRDDEVKRLKALAFKHKSKGEPIPNDIRGRLKKVLADRGLFFWTEYTGKLPTAKQMDIFNSLPEKWTADLLGEVPATRRKAADVAVEMGKLTLREYEARTERIRADTGWDAAQFNREKQFAEGGGAGKYHDRIFKTMISPLQSYLNKFLKDPSRLQQVLSSELLTKEEKDLYVEMMGKGPVKQEKLMQIKRQVDLLNTKAQKSKLDRDELLWLSDAYDLFTIADKESPEDRYQGLKERLIKLGVSPEDAETEARREIYGVTR